MSAKKPPARPAKKVSRSAKVAGKQSPAVRSAEPGQRQAFEEAARMTLAMFRLDGTATKAQRTAQVKRSIDDGLKEDLARYPLLVLRRLRTLLKQEIAQRETEAAKTGGSEKPEQKVIEQAAWLHATFVRHGMAAAEADQLIAGLTGLDVRTIQRHRTEHAGRASSK